MRNLSCNSGLTSCIVRWAFNFRAWNPTEQEWMLAAQWIQPEEKTSIEKFVFKKDAKASMAGQLLIRKFIHTDTGSYTVLAGEVGVGQVVGVDVIHFERRTGHKLNEFFRLMSRTFATKEWETINSFTTDKEKVAMFYRLWCLKESYVKAIGVGITLDLRRIRFHINTQKLSRTEVCKDTELFIDDERKLDWRFEEWLLNDDHCVAVALSGNNNSSTPPPFQILDWSKLDLTPIIPPDPSAAHKFFVKDDSLE